MNAQQATQPSSHDRAAAFSNAASPRFVTQNHRPSVVFYY